MARRKRRRGRRTKVGTCSRKCKGKKIRAFRACVRQCARR
jgi:hypothetical protein